MNANQIVEKKADTPEKLAAAAGKPTRNFLFARELNEIVARLQILWTLQNFNGSQIIPGLKKDLGTLVGQTFVEKINTSVATPFASPSYVVYTIGDVNYTQAFVGAEGAKGNGAGQVDAVDFLLVEQSDEPVEPVLNNPANYSLEEVNTGGTWIDGKPIYRKVFTGFSNTTNTAINVAALDIDSIRIVSGVLSSEIIQYDVNYSSTSFNNGGLNLQTEIVSMKYDREDDSLFIHQSIKEVVISTGTTVFETNISDFDYSIIIEYTKTTD